MLIATFGLACNFLSKKEETNANNSNSVVEKNKENANVKTENSPVASPEADSAKTENLLSLASGAYLVKQPEWDRAFDHNPINLIFDGMMWRSDEGKVTNQVFVIETPGETTLKKVGFDTKHIFYTTEENAKDILLEASNTNAESGFQTILETSLEQESKISEFPVKTETPARWFRLTVKNNHGSMEAVSLKRMFGYGTQKTADVPQNLNGTYREIDKETGKAKDSDSGDLFIKQEGTSVAGCWRENGSFSGGLTGTVANLDWQQPDLGKNTGLMVFADNKRVIFWRLKNEGFWALEQFEKVNSDLGNCPDIPNFKSGDTAKSEIAKELEKDGRAVIYGINFDFNSDKLRSESKIVLDKIVTLLKEKSDWKMGIEGHTDNIGGESFNQNLSEKRAKAVVDYLISAGIDASRLSSKGMGLSNPISPNDTELGRAKNRRVELAKQ
ncbi:MAG TPA: OmpA family protein [Pyrinomonadaceae bacterium]|nr:OmpA family protein [Pyrinomonadaceae bacterium]